MAIPKERPHHPDKSPASDSGQKAQSSLRIIEMQKVLYLELSQINDLLERHICKQKSGENDKKTS